MTHRSGHSAPGVRGAGGRSMTGDLGRQVAIVRARLPLLLAGVVLAAGVGFLVSSRQPSTFEARATLIVGQSLTAANPDINGLLTSQRLSATYANVATTRIVLDRVIEQLQSSETPEALARRIQVEAPRENPWLFIRVRDVDPTRAASIANALGQELVEVSPAVQGRQADIQKAIDANLDATQDRIESSDRQVARLTALPNRTPAEDEELRTLQAQLISLRSTYAGLVSFSSNYTSNLVTMVQPAVPPTEPVGPNVFLMTVLAGFLGLLVVSAAIFLRERLDDRMRDPSDVEDVIGLRTLGAIGRMRDEGDEGAQSPLGRLGAIARDRRAGRSPSIRPPATLSHPGSQVAEAYRSLRWNIEFASTGTPIRSLLVVSSVRAEGRTTTAANLAVVFAQGGRRVLLVDADLRRPRMHEVFDLPNDRGLTTLLSCDDADTEAVVQATEQSGLRVLTSGSLPPHAASVLDSERMRSVFLRLLADQDLVIVDSPPLQTVADAAVFSLLVDASVFVVDAGRTRRQVVGEAMELLAMAGTPLLGAVLNRVPIHARPHVHDYFDPSAAWASATTAATTTTAASTATTATTAPTAGRGPRSAAASRQTRRGRSGERSA
jgi:succinoglycan biosynthesis transport protein ExoP